MSSYQRKDLTFEQAEGIDPLPSQLARGQISQEFRARLWAELIKHFEASHRNFEMAPGRLDIPWSRILQDANVRRYHRLDDFPREYRQAVARVQQIIEQASWSDVLGWLEFVLKHPSCSVTLKFIVPQLMTDCRLAYRVVDDCVICPIASEAESETIEKAFTDVRAAKLEGAGAHLRNAASELTAGNFANSVRESIHAVEATARKLEPSAALSGALQLLESKANIHNALKRGLAACMVTQATRRALDIPCSMTEMRTSMRPTRYS